MSESRVPVLWVCDEGHVIGPNGWWMPRTCTARSDWNQYVYCGAPVKERATLFLPPLPKETESA